MNIWQGLQLVGVGSITLFVVVLQLVRTWRRVTS